ncbi:MAG: energy transducer TonB [Bryobacteraceae bacterium]
MTEVAVEKGGLDLDLLRGLPEARPPRYWFGVLTGSLLVHLFVFLIALRLPSFAVRSQPEARVARPHVILYLPRDVMTQRAPNRDKLSKSIDLADLMATPSQQAARATPAPNVRRFELPKNSAPQKVTAPPQILPEAPKIALNQAPPAPIPGALTGLAVPPPPPAEPKQNSSPFQNIGSDAPANPHPTLAPPKAGIDNVIKDLAQKGAGQKLVITDDNTSEPTPPVPGSVGSAATAQHAAVELESDPQGADFKAYLTRILAIVRANWQHVIPESARMGVLRGRTTLQFIVDRDGQIVKVVIADSSGSAPLDQAAVAGLSMSNKLPPLPGEFRGFQVRLAFSFAYNVATR